MSNLKKIRLIAARRVLAYSTASGAVSATPTPSMELPKHFVMTTADVMMCLDIWSIYFEERLSREELMHILKDLGLVTLAGTATAYLMSKAITALMGEVSNFFGPVGWGLAGVVTISINALFGAVWIMYCDSTYRQSHTNPQLA